MSLSNAKNTEITPIKETEFDIFSRWLALPSKLRKPETQGKFAEKYGVHYTTISGWKRSRQLWEKVQEYREEWAKAETSDVIAALARRAKRTGEPAAVKLWMEIIEKFVEKKEITSVLSEEEIKNLRVEFKEFMHERVKKKAAS